MSEKEEYVLTFIKKSPKWPRNSKICPDNANFYQNNSVQKDLKIKKKVKFHLKILPKWHQNNQIDHHNENFWQRYILQMVEKEESSEKLTWKFIKKTLKSQNLPKNGNFDRNIFFLKCM